ALVHAANTKDSTESSRRSSHSACRVVSPHEAKRIPRCRNTAGDCKGSKTSKFLAYCQHPVARRPDVSPSIELHQHHLVIGEAIGKVGYGQRRRPVTVWRFICDLRVPHRIGRYDKGIARGPAACCSFKGLPGLPVPIQTGNES